jgi:tRNA nucleotidyltransferase/poly(A) polymerase
LPAHGNARSALKGGPIKDYDWAVELVLGLLNTDGARHIDTFEAFGRAVDPPHFKLITARHEHRFEYQIEPASGGVNSSAVLYATDQTIEDLSRGLEIQNLV